MTQQAIQCAALAVADRIMDLVSDYLPERERAAVWKRFYQEVEAGILAVLWAEIETIRWMPGRN